MTRGEFLKTVGSAAVLAATGDSFGAEAAGGKAVVPVWGERVF